MHQTLAMMVQGIDGNSAADLASTDEVKELLSEPAKAFSF